MANVMQTETESGEKYKIPILPFNVYKLGKSLPQPSLAPE